MSDAEDRRQELASQLRRLQKKAEDLRGEVTFSEVIEEATDAEASLPAVGAELERLRARGYAFRGDLEDALGEVRDQLGDAVAELRDRAERASDRMRGEARTLSRQAAKLTPRKARRIEALDAELRGFKREVREVRERLEALTAPLRAKLAMVSGKTKDLHWTLDQFDGASFKLQPAERPVAVTQATWEDAPGGAQPAGLLMFTDHRVYFEQKEEKVTKRTFIFFAAETESLHKLMIDEPLGHLEDASDATRGWVMKDQLLAFSWAREAKAPEKTTFKLASGTASDWDGVVELLRAGDLKAYEADAASTATSDVVGGAPPTAARHEVRWPENCAACAAPLTAPVKGQTAIACGYCGTNHAVEFVET